jgi:hypothetical protein
MTSGKVNSHFFILLLLFVGLCAAVIDLRAQQPSPQATAAPSSTPAPSPSPASVQPAPMPTQQAPQPVVTGVEGHLELDVVIKVQIDHLAEWDANGDVTKLVPYLNGRALKGNYPEEVHASKNHLYFHLEISPENKEVWSDLLGEPDGTHRLVTFSVGLEDPSPFETVYDQNNRLPLTVISPRYGILSLIVVIGTLIIFIWLAQKSNIIRDPGPNPGGGKLKPYSLGRTQMAIWFFLIYVSYQVIWLITGALDTITPSLLALMGISAGTALSDALIDSGKDSTRVEQFQALTAEQQALEQSIPDLQARAVALKPGSPPTPEDTYNRDDLNKQLLEARTRLNQISQQLKTITPTATSNVSLGFRRDILSDGNGYSFHRFQIFAWTIVLGIIFLSSVYNNLTMPEFSATLLGLMGISSGTYLGFKFPEKR